MSPPVWVVTVAYTAAVSAVVSVFLWELAKLAVAQRRDSRGQAIARRQTEALRLAARGFEVCDVTTITHPDSPILLDTPWNQLLAQLLDPATEAREESRT